MDLWIQDDIEQAITDKTILVSLIHVNNEVGTVQPVREIGERLKKYPKVLFHVDHVQGAGTRSWETDTPTS